LVIEYLEGAREDQSVLRLCGALTMDTVGQFQNAIRGENASRMILDLSYVPYIDSAGLGSIVSAHVSLQKAGRWMALTGVNERVLKLFEITRVGKLFLTFPSLGEAIHALSAEPNA
jgi:anti-sigma B factor antagonist